MSNLPDLKRMIMDESSLSNLKAMLGSKAQGFATSVLSVVANNRLLQNVSPQSIYTCAMIAASLDLPINPNLGFAALIPYNGMCQCQIMTKGFIQLAIRSGQYQKINNAIVYEGQLVKEDPFTGDYQFDCSAKKSDKVIGYVAYFKTIGGFEKYLYMTKDELLAHGKKYSKTFGKKNKDGDWTSLWQTNEDSMCLKTILKLLLSKYGILSIEMQRAIRFDQASVKGEFNGNIDDLEADYVDNPQTLDKEKVKKVSKMFETEDITAEEVK